MSINHIDFIKNYWNDEAENYYNDHPEHLDKTLHPSWGLFHVPEEKLRLVIDDNINEGTNILEIGCGIGHDAVAYASLGANVFGLDISTNQLKNSIPHKNVKYINCSAENTPFKNSYFDIIICDHGAFDHSPPSIILKECSRILKKGGSLVICTYSPLAKSCYNQKSGMIEPFLNNEYPKNTIKFDKKITNVSYNYEGWISEFLISGFDIISLKELTIPEDMKNFYDQQVYSEWAEKWPLEIIWKLRLK